jgi:steroid 5-alpha reductase family enzyme
MPESFLFGLAPGTPAGVLTGAAVFLFVYFTAWFLLTEALRNGGLVDIGWGLGFVILAGWRLFTVFSLPAFLLWLAVACWGLRLAIHIGLRNIGRPEDPRYAGFRKEWGRGYPLRAYFQLFLFQGLMMGLISLPFLLGLEGYRQTRVLAVPVFLAGLLVFWFGLGFETQADRQLAVYLAKRKKQRSQTKDRNGATEADSDVGPVLNTGLWAWSRHPNYFGEAVAWWGIWFMSISMGAPWWTLVGPAAITLLLRYVSGVPLLEKRMRGRPGYDAYAASTPIFIPRRPGRV